MPNGFDALLYMYLPIKYQAQQRRTLCPVCAYPVVDTLKGQFCRFCNWHEGIPPRFLPHLPDQTGGNTL